MDERDERIREGGCACGAVRYRVVGEPICVHNCHCTQCQQQTGSTSVVNMFYETERLTQLSGETSRNVVKAGSGNDHIIVRCAACGTAMWSHYARLGPHAAGIRVGTLDDPGTVRPNVAIYVAERMPWVTLPEGIPAFDAFYRMSDVLPPDRVARMAAVAARAAQA